MEEQKLILSLLFFSMAFGFYVFTALCYTGYWILQKDWMGQTGTAMCYVGLVSLTVTLIARAKESGYTPWSNLYETMVLFVWVITVFYLILEYKHKLKVIGAMVMSLCVLALFIASSMPYKYKSVSPLNPALQNKWNWLKDLLGPEYASYAVGWLDIHVFMVFVSYGAFAIAFGTSIMFLIKDYTETRGISHRLIDAFPSTEILDEISYKTITWGFPWLGLGLIAGGAWANYAWGAYWSWDPKETWSLITWFIYGGYLHARLTKGWHGKETAYLSVLGFAGVVFLYWGVSFIIPGLHAYA